MLEEGIFSYITDIVVGMAKQFNINTAAPDPAPEFTCCSPASFTRFPQKRPIFGSDLMMTITLAEMLLGFTPVDLERHGTSQILI